jgi:hypothetical protein
MLLVLQKDATPFPGLKCHHLTVPVTGDGGQLIGVRLIDNRLEIAQRATRIDRTPVQLLRGVSDTANDNG